MYVDPSAYLGLFTSTFCVIYVAGVVDGAHVTAATP